MHRKQVLARFQRRIRNNMDQKKHRLWTKNSNEKKRHNLIPDGNGLAWVLAVIGKVANAYCAPHLR
jgi:hypothetical protein